MFIGASRPGSLHFPTLYLSCQAENLRPAGSDTAILNAVFLQQIVSDPDSSVVFPLDIDFMTILHRNKTFTTLLAAVFGSIGLHRFYLYGRRDWFGWLHIVSLPVSVMAILMLNNVQPLFVGILFILSILSGFLEALVIGLTPDEKWDAKHNHNSGKQSESHWVLALILVATLAVGATAVIALLARGFDLFFTGGAYG